MSGVSNQHPCLHSKPRALETAPCLAPKPLLHAIPDITPKTHHFRTTSPPRPSIFALIFYLSSTLPVFFFSQHNFSFVSRLPHLLPPFSCFYLSAPLLSKLPTLTPTPLLATLLNIVTLLATHLTIVILPHISKPLFIP